MTLQEQDRLVERLEGADTIAELDDIIAEIITEVSRTDDAIARHTLGMAEMIRHLDFGMPLRSLEERAESAMDR
jgi:hypothetical protein